LLEQKIGGNPNSVLPKLAGGLQKIKLKHLNSVI